MQTISAQLAKKLKDKDFCEDAFFCWTLPEIGKSLEMILVISQKNAPFCTPAYTLDEILDFLPDVISNNESYFLTLEKVTILPKFEPQDNRYLLKYCFHHGVEDSDAAEEEIIIHKKHQNPAEAAGELLLWCIKKGYVKTDE